MTRLAPTFPAGNLQERDHEVYNCWQVPGDTPDFIRVYSKPGNLSVHHDIYDLATQCYSWTNLPSGTAMSLSVSCMYADGDERGASFSAKTTGPHMAAGDGGDQPETEVPEPVLQNLTVTVLPYLRGVTLEWDVLANVGQVDVYYTVVKDGWMGLASLYNHDAPNHGQHMSYLITPEKHLQYGRTFYVKLGVAARQGGVVSIHDFFTEFITPDDPRFDDDPTQSQRPISIRDHFKNKALGPVDELDPDAGPHHPLSP